MRYTATAKTPLFSTGNPRWRNSYLALSLRFILRRCAGNRIKVIVAHGPQAKGRVERNHAVCQDRFVKDLRLAGISTIEAANKFLQKTCLSKINAKFARQPTKPGDAYALLLNTGLWEIMCSGEDRTVSRDFVVIFKNQLFQILSKKYRKPHPG